MDCDKASMATWIHNALQTSHELGLNIGRKILQGQVCWLFPFDSAWTGNEGSKAPYKQGVFGPGQYWAEPTADIACDMEGDGVPVDCFPTELPREVWSLLLLRCIASIECFCRFDGRAHLKVGLTLVMCSPRSILGTTYTI